MVTLLDDEYVLQMDDIPPFTWLAKSHERIMNCSIRSEDKIIIHAKGNAFTYSLISKNISGRNAEVDEFYENTEEGLHIIISTGGDEENSINFLKSFSGKCVVVSGGGQIKKIAREKGYEFISLPKGMPSRFMFPEIIGCISGLTDVENKNDLRQDISKLSPASLTEENIAKSIAIKMMNRRPVILYGERGYGFARKFFEDLLQNSGIISSLMSINQIDMIEDIGDGSVVIEIAKSKKQRFKNSLFMEIREGLAGAIYLLTLMSYISLYLSLLNERDFFLFDRLKE
ncbi:MAG: hypothetical protein ACP5RG_04225 [Thermoplasmata archaeon]